MESVEILENMIAHPAEKSLSLLTRGWMKISCLDPDARVSLIDWMVQVQQYLGLTDTVLHSAVANLDLVLSKVDWDGGEVQLLGLATILLAAKIEEDTPPSMDLLLPLCGGVYTKVDLARVEMEVLECLDWTLAESKATVYLHLYSDITMASQTIGGDSVKGPNGKRSVLRLARALLDISLTQSWFHAEPGMKMAAACYASATLLMGNPWDGELIHLTGFSLHKMFNLIKHILRTVSDIGAEGISEKHSRALKVLSKSGRLSSVLVDGLETIIKSRTDSRCETKSG